MSENNNKPRKSRAQKAKTAQQATNIITPDFKKNATPATSSQHDKQQAIRNDDNASIPKHGIEQGELLEQHEDDEVEYEYVPISEVTDGVIWRIRDFIDENKLIVSIAIFVVFAFLFIGIAKTMNGLFIAIAFGALTICFGAILYIAWRDKQEKEKAWRRADAVMQSVRQSMREELEQGAHDVDDFDKKRR